MIWGAALAGLSIASSIFGNQQTQKQLEENVANIKNSYNKQIGNLQQQFNSANENIALEMTTARFNALKLSGSTTNAIVNHNIAGNTAVKEYNASAMSSMFTQNALQKKAEDTWKSYGVEMDNAKINANNAIYSAANQASASMKSPLSIATSAAGAYMAGEALGEGISGMAATATTAAEPLVAITPDSLTSAAGYGDSMTTVNTSLTNSYFGI